MLSQTINKIFSIIVVFQLIFCPVAFADEGKIADISEGDAAPFSGVLMTNDIATKLYLDSKFSPGECDIKIEERLSFKNLECKRDEDLLISKLEIQKDKFDKIIFFKDDRINFLEKNWKPQPWYKAGELWFSFGVVSGVLITVATGYALGQIAK